MKKLMISLAVLLMLGTTVFADVSNSDVATVIATVSPNIAVNYEGSVVTGNVQTGDFVASITFRVDANTQFVKFCVEGSGLYKAGIVNNPDTPPIPLSSDPVEISADNANPAGGADNLIDWTTELADINGFPGIKTEDIIFESMQIGHFSQDVHLLMKWLQDDPEKPTGEYVGKVRLVAMVVPVYPVP